MKILGDPLLRQKFEELFVTKIYRDIDSQNIEKLIRKGESQSLEFKSTLRWDVKNNIQLKDLEKNVLKTIAAFLNTKNGGQLLVGIEDNGTVFGLEKDYQLLQNGNRDKFENTLVQLLKTHIGFMYIQHLTIAFDALDGKDVCLVTVEKSDQPAYLKYGNTEEFFIRTGNSTTSLSMRDTQEYIKKNWST
jgi:predicted HTH transcriptional regulator